MYFIIAIAIIAFSVLTVTTESPQRLVTAKVTRADRNR